MSSRKDRGLLTAGVEGLGVSGLGGLGFIGQVWGLFVLSDQKSFVARSMGVTVDDIYPALP